MPRDIHCMIVCMSRLGNALKQHGCHDMNLSVFFDVLTVHLKCIVLTTDRKSNLIITFLKTPSNPDSEHETEGVKRRTVNHCSIG